MKIHVYFISFVCSCQHLNMFFYTYNANFRFMSSAASIGSIFELSMRI